MSKANRLLSDTGEMSYFGLRAIVSAFPPPSEWSAMLKQLEEIGGQSVPLIGAAGLALGTLTTLTRQGR